MTDTIFALSSGRPPAAIALIRISGPRASAVTEELCGSLPEPRRASVRTLRDQDGGVLDEAMVLWLPGPNTSTGEDIAEYHCHGGSAVISAVEDALEACDGVRHAEPGEFTRRAFVNGRIDLAQAEGLGDLLAAETDLQRRVAQQSASGILSQRFADWRSRLLMLSARVEAVLDFDDEDDVTSLSDTFFAELSDLASEWDGVLAEPRAERLREGIRVVLAGPPNSGKSSLFNVLLDESVAIVSDQAGTTRDVIERPVALAGIPFVLIDTAGIRYDSIDNIENIGIAKARKQAEEADVVLWLGPEGEGPQGAWEIESFADAQGVRKKNPRHLVSAVTKEGVQALIADLIAEGRRKSPSATATTINRRQSDALQDACVSLRFFKKNADPLAIAEALRLARKSLDKLTGHSSTEEVLDNIFGRFCIGK